MRRLAVIVLAFLALPASAQAFQFTIHANGWLDAATVTKIERAVSWQVNRQVAKEWSGINPVSFVPAGGAPIIVVGNNEISQDYGPEAEGCHWYVDAEGGNTFYPLDGVAIPNVGVIIAADGQQGVASTEVTISHEVIEAEVNPQVDRYVNGHLAEVCDPVQWQTYRGLEGVMLEDWVYPAYFYGDHAAIERKL